MKKDWQTHAPPVVRARIEHELKTHGQLFAMRKAIECGYDYPDVTTPITDRLKELDAAGDRAGWLAFRRLNLTALQQEERAVLLLQGTRKWATEPDAAEQAATLAEQRAEERRQTAIAERTRELLATDDAKRVEGARKRAEKELAP